MTDGTMLSRTSTPVRSHPLRARGLRAIRLAVVVVATGCIFVVPPSSALVSGLILASGGFVCPSGSGSGDAILSIDPMTGDRAVLSGSEPFGGDCVTVGSGAVLGDVGPIAEDLVGLLLAGDGDGSGGGARVLVVDPETGNRSVLSGCDGAPLAPSGCSGPIVGTGPSFDFVQALEVVDPEAASHPGLAGELGNALIGTDVGDCSSDTILVLDRSTGDRRVLSGPDASCALVGSGDPISEINALELTPDGVIWAADGDGSARVVRVETDTGNRSVASGCDTLERGRCTGVIVGSGPALSFVRGLEQADPMAPILALAVLSDCFGDAILAIDPVSGDRTVISGLDAACNPVGSGPAIFDAESLGRSPDGSLLVSEDQTGRLLRVDPTTGAREVVAGCSDPTPSGACAPPAFVVGAGPQPGFLLSPIVFVPEPSIPQMTMAAAVAMLVLFRLRGTRRRLGKANGSLDQGSARRSAGGTRARSPRIVCVGR